MNVFKWLYAVDLGYLPPGEAKGANTEALALFTLILGYSLSLVLTEPPKGSWAGDYFYISVPTLALMVCILRTHDAVNVDKHVYDRGTIMLTRGIFTLSVVVVLSMVARTYTGTLPATNFVYASKPLKFGKAVPHQYEDKKEGFTVQTVLDKDTYRKIPPKLEMDITLRGDLGTSWKVVTIDGFTDGGKQAMPFGPVLDSVTNNISSGETTYTFLLRGLVPDKDYSFKLFMYPNVEKANPNQAIILVEKQLLTGQFRSQNKE